MCPLLSLKNKCIPASLVAILFCWMISNPAFGQKTVIKGFVDAGMAFENSKVSFNLGEQDLFITSSLSDRISFLGETVFKFDTSSHSSFDVSIERIVIKYNINGNHNLLLGKHHTPLNYWNDTYHHGRLFFPTIDRPLLFAAGIIPLHTTGLSLQGHDLGKLKIGYDLMVGNGLGSSEVFDNDQHKSWSAAVYMKPAERLRLGLSYYNDVISEGADVHDHEVHHQVNQQLITGSIAYFGKKFELLTEATLGLNHTDSTGTTNTQAMYAYAGYKLSEKWIPYIRADYLHYEDDELYFSPDNTTAFLIGLRYQINYLTVIKLEYQIQDSDLKGNIDRIKAQVAIGF